jgi:hypothetical protein
MGPHGPVTGFPLPFLFAYITRYSQVLMKLEFSLQIFKNLQISNFMKILQVVADLFHADWQTDGETYRHDEDNGRFSKFYERT